MNFKKKRCKRTTRYPWSTRWMGNNKGRFKYKESPHELEKYYGLCEQMGPKIH